MESHSPLASQCIKAHILQEFRELLLELHGLQQLIDAWHLAQKDSHPVFSIQMLDVTLPPVAWVFTLQINTATSPSIHAPTSCSSSCA